MACLQFRPLSGVLLDLRERVSVAYASGLGRVESPGFPGVPGLSPEFPVDLGPTLLQVQHRSSTIASLLSSSSAVCTKYPDLLVQLEIYSSPMDLRAENFGS